MMPRAVIVVCDSLGAEYVDAQRTPTLHSLRQHAAEFTHARSVFPSTTRTSSASMATGCLPSAHGLLGNTMVIDEGEGLVCLSAGAPDFLDRLRRATSRTLRRPTLAERLAAHGGAVIYSNVSPGAAYLHDPDGHGHVHHRSGSFGPGRVPLPASPPIQVGRAGDAWLTEAFCRDALVESGPALALLWLSEPDHSAHHHPLDSTEHRTAMLHADACVQRVRERVRALDPDGSQILLIACSDHGMETVNRRIDVTGLLIEAGFKRDRDSTDVVVAPNGNSVIFHFDDSACDRVDAIARWLRAQDFCGRVLQGGDITNAGLPLSGSLRLAMTMRWHPPTDDDPHARGSSDTVASPFSHGSPPGCAQHGGLGPREQHPFLLIEGPGFTPGPQTRDVSLIDIAPTVLRHLNQPCDGMQGTGLQTP